MSDHDDDVLRQTVSRLVLPIAWLLAAGRNYSLRELALKVVESLTPAEREAAVRDWADRRLLEAGEVTDPAERTVHGLMLLVRPAVERLRGLGYVTSGMDFETHYRIEGKKWQKSPWGSQIEAISAAFDKARKAVEPLVADGNLFPPATVPTVRAAVREAAT